MALREFELNPSHGTADFPDEKIVVSLIRELSWSHFLALLPLKEPLQREYYAEMCRAQRWSVRALRETIGGLLYERTALSRKPAELARLELAALRDEDRVCPRSGAARPLPA